MPAAPITGEGGEGGGSLSLPAAPYRSRAEEGGGGGGGAEEGDEGGGGGVGGGGGPLSLSAAPHHCGDRGRSSRRRRRMSRRRIPKVGSRPPQSMELAWKPFLKKIKISLRIYISSRKLNCPKVSKFRFWHNCYPSGDYIFLTKLATS